MSKVQAKILCFVDNGLRQPGDIFEYSGPPNKNVELLDGSWNNVISESTVTVIEATKRKLGRPKMTKDTDGA